MGAHCCSPGHSHDHGHGHGHDHGAGGDHRDPRYRKILWVALAVNAIMFLVELSAGLASRSVSLQADSADFLGDAANYGLSLAVLGSSLAWRARASVLKAATMGLFGIWVLATTVLHLVRGTVPEPSVMTAIGVLAFLANLGVAALLYRYRTGDSNMRSVWLCTRNDALSNLAVLLAASGVFASGSGWPDLVVAAIMAGLALWGAVSILRHARSELAVE